MADTPKLESWQPEGEDRLRGTLNGRVVVTQRVKGQMPKTGGREVELEDGKITLGEPHKSAAKPATDTPPAKS